MKQLFNHQKIAIVLQDELDIDIKQAQDLARNMLNGDLDSVPRGIRLKERLAPLGIRLQD